MSDRASHLTSHGEGRGVADADFRPDDVTDWGFVRENIRRYIERFGMPTQVDDLSVDEVTERRLARSDFAGHIKIWSQPGGPRFHPGVKTLIEESLKGRNPDVDVDSEPLTILLNAADDSFETQLEIETFAYKLAMLLGGLPWVVVSRYKNFTMEDIKKD